MGKPARDEIHQDEILARLRKHLNEQRPIKLYNTYNGVPISYEAEVAMVHPSFVGLIVHPFQAVCIKLERRTYLESNLIPALVRANPVSIDYTNNVVLLKHLKIPKRITADLYNSRVAPEKPVTVEISSETNKGLSVKLLDIAVLGENRVRVGMAVLKDIPYGRKDDVTLAFRLELDGDLIRLQGVVHSLKKIRNKGQMRLEVEGKVAMGEEISILASIAKREDQIMGELDKAYMKLRKGKKRKAG